MYYTNCKEFYNDNYNNNITLLVVTMQEMQTLERKGYYEKNKCDKS